MSYLYRKPIFDLVIVLFQINFHWNKRKEFILNNRYYRKILTILEIDPKMIHEELVTALGSNAPSYTTAIR